MEARQHRSFAVEGGRRACLGIVHFKGLVFVASDLDPHLSQRIPPQNLPHAVLRYVSNQSLRGVVFNSLHGLGRCWLPPIDFRSV